MRKTKWKKILLVALTSMGVLLVAAGSYGWNLVTSTFTSIQEDIDRKESEKRLEGINFEEGDPFSVLLMGIDEPGSEGDTNQRSDALLLLTVNPDKKSTHMVSIPRDTYTDIAGENIKDKINHSYAFGGTQMTMRTVENFLDLPVDYFIRIDMQGFEDMVDAVDGVEVTNDFEFTYKGVHFEEGPIQLNGEEAVTYSRMRKDDPRGDLGRQERQRKIIRGMIDKGSNFSSITKVEGIFGVIEDNVRTNFSLNEIWEIQSNYSDALERVEQHEIEGEDGEIDETYYYMPDENQVEELSDVLKEHLEEEN
ncbi:transcriptional regulator LytR [Halobacillus andaensis]|uniref:Transcriptional regulator LytR n=1 Tax=Halobacillus andaensis TaxID=1176239 RepID=A0A917EXL5_HALAA|nr:LCP family protein [Halobacillus andaensis]MBP2005118.1 LCP family protein required for cell wall assembly [Halobacillus andaensis]GGF28994.1 transcriptional regulator LytR [Halobacillus andaensis]